MQWNHLCFVACLWCYTLACVTLASLPGRLLERGGALLTHQAHIWRQMESQRFTALGLALACWAVMVIYVALPENVLPGPPEAWPPAI